ncbi:MAG: hypothetical protein M1836_002304 [Candelina mexicana]|nr:MAG: hypothetical protein M1836_002304 [Candelina mexicana]
MAYVSASPSPSHSLTPSLQSKTPILTPSSFSGDAVHPILPYMAQGANSALEDAAVFSSLLSHATSSTQEARKEKIKHAIETYEKIRKPRVEWVSAETVRLQQEHHLLDGPAQQLRDREMSAADWYVQNPLPS